ncbi:MAG TPA: hypothetical protein VHD39_06560 [Acidimicrobiales bacterium]|nr:hypothetical protein [Acidimicrobiales bacterium]
MPTADAAPAGAGAARTDDTGNGDGRPRRRLSQRAIALVGLGFAVAFLAAVALDHALSNDELWSLAAGQWMLAHHSVMGSDPFSYTESHRRWVTDEWGSEVALAALVRSVGSAAYAIYAVVLGGCCLAATAAYARVLGARGGRIAAIVLLLAAGLAGTVAADRGLDFSLVWFPVLLLILAKARTSPGWLWLLPPLCLAWVNTHGSILLGLAVIALELAWSLAPLRVVRRLNGVQQSPYPGPLALALVGSLLASCVTPYGPGLLAYDVGVARNSQIAQYITEWSSPNFHSLMTLLVFLVPLGVMVTCLWNRRIPLLECSLTAVLFIEALQTQRLAVYLMVAAAGLAATIPGRRPWSTTARRWAGGAFVVLGIVVVALPSVPAGTVSSTEPVRAFDALQSHPGRIFTQYTWGDYSIARHRATFVDGRTDLFEGSVLTQFFDVSNLSVDPDPIFSAHHVDYVVWSPHTALSVYLGRDPRWRVVDRTSVAVVFARRTQSSTASRPRVSPSSSAQTSTASNP